MGKPTIETNEDHLLVRFSPLDAATGLTRAIIVPFTDVVTADVAPPEWPSWREVWGMGVRAPPFVLKGSIGKPLGPWDRFYWQDRGTTRVLRLHLAGHPRFRELHLDVEDPDGLLKRIEARRMRPR